MNLILVRQREEQQEVVLANENVEEPIDSDTEVTERVIIHDIQVEEVEQMEEILEKDERELETLFIDELENLTHSTMLDMEPHMKLPKVKLDNQTCHSGNKILALYLRDVDTIPELCDKVNAISRAIASKLGACVNKEQPGKRREMQKEETIENVSLRKRLKNSDRKLQKPATNCIEESNGEKQQPKRRPSSRN